MELDHTKAGIFQGTKQLKAWPMTRGEYNVYRGWELPAGEDPKEPGYLVEYLDGGKPNDERHSGYISWSPADVFERSYYDVQNFKDAAANQIASDAWEAHNRRRVALDFATRHSGGCGGMNSDQYLQMAEVFEKYLTGPTTWQERLEAERTELYGRRDALYKFIGSVEFGKLPIRVRDLLNTQYDLMDQLYGVLVERQRD